jgi:hypothetical protein
MAGLRALGLSFLLGLVLVEDPPASFGYQQ